LSCNDGHYVGDIADELMIAELELLILAFMVILFEHVLLNPLRHMMRYTLIVCTLDMVLGELVLFIGIRWLLEVKCAWGGSLFPVRETVFCLMEGFN
jgi:hypothetical protein